MAALTPTARVAVALHTLPRDQHRDWSRVYAELDGVTLVKSRIMYTGISGMIHSPYFAFHVVVGTTIRRVFLSNPSKADAVAYLRGA